MIRLQIVQMPAKTISICFALVRLQFVKFANIEEDTPSYHRRYDFFVSKFASLCHNNHPEIEVQNRLRVAGLKGIQVNWLNRPLPNFSLSLILPLFWYKGVVRKTVSDDLVENIWESVHMDKIVPSLLFNMQT